MAQSDVGICNRALAKLGAAQIVSFNDPSVNARACNANYFIVRSALFRDHPWNFAIQRFQLAASPTPPVFGPANYYPLPTGWRRVLAPDTKWNINDRDWIIEGGAIVTDEVTPLDVRIVMEITDPTLFDPSFCEALSAHLALELCEALTQSNEKKTWCAQDAKNSIDRAKKANAIEKVAQLAAEDWWITQRL